MKYKKVALIAGGSDGLGKEIAIKLGDKYAVIILSPNETKLEKVSKEIGVDYMVCDITDYKNCVAVIQNIRETNQQIEVLVNSAGQWIQGEVDENDPNNIRQVIEVNALGVVNLIKAVVPEMKKQGQGTIININSQAGFYAKEERAVYNMTKWGLTGFTKSLQPELAKYGIRVTDIHPGKMKTQMFEKMGIHKDMNDSLDPIYVAQMIDAILELPSSVCVPELGIKYLTN